jgi:SagB-type dehydrogenase family enzyme
MTAAAAKALSPAEVAFAYHKRTKHSLERYAAGPETLDWDDQPNPFREFAGAPRTALPFTTDELETTFAQLYAPGVLAPAPLTLASVSALLELSMGLSAWKEYGPDRWALRCNPSSGNLHPTEAYIVCNSVSGLDDGLHHYVSRDHALEHRCRSSGGAGGTPRLLVGLTSIHWREAWKYGERAFRYCQLDIGHALGAFRYAAGALGWGARIVTATASADIQAILGLGRPDDFAGVELEDPELLIEIDLSPASALSQPTSALSFTHSGEGAAPQQWAGRQSHRPAPLLPLAHHRRGGPGDARAGRRGPV